MAKDKGDTQRDRSKAGEHMARRRGDDTAIGWGDREIGSGGARTTTDGRPVGAGHPDGWQSGGRGDDNR